MMALTDFLKRFLDPSLESSLKEVDADINLSYREYGVKLVVSDNSCHTCEWRAKDLVTLEKLVIANPDGLLYDNDKDGYQ